MYKYFIFTTIGVAVFLITAMSRELFNGLPLADTLMALSDGCFVAGVLLAGISGLSWVSSRGGYDIFGFGISTLKSHFNHSKDFRAESFYDYKVRKDKERKAWLIEALVVGAVFIALAIVFLIVYLVI